MKTTILAIAAACALATTTFAAEVSGSANLEFTKNAADDVVASTTIGLDVTGMGDSFASIGFESVDSSSIEIDTYSFGTVVNGVTVSFGKQEDLFASPGLEVVGGETLVTPADDVVSVRASAGALAVQLGFSDLTTDASELENIQAAYGAQIGVVSLDGAIDYNFDTEDTIVAGTAAVDASVAQVVLDVSYADAFAYELSANNYGATVFVNGDENDSFQNVGAGYTGTYNQVTYYVEAGYNVDTEDFTPAAGVTFSF